MSPSPVRRLEERHPLRRLRRRLARSVHCFATDPPPTIPTRDIHGFIVVAAEESTPPPLPLPFHRLGARILKRQGSFGSTTQQPSSVGPSRSECVESSFGALSAPFEYSSRALKHSDNADDDEDGSGSGVGRARCCSSVPVGTPVARFCCSCCSFTSIRWSRSWNASSYSAAVAAPPPPPTIELSAPSLVLLVLIGGTGAARKKWRTTPARAEEKEDDDGDDEDDDDDDDDVDDDDDMVKSDMGERSSVSRP